MKDIVWSDILSVGFNAINEDHRKLVGIFNILTADMRLGTCLSEAM